MATDDIAIAPQQVVFIDSDVPDIQDLIAGLAPGVRAFVLDPSSDGVQQIANILAADDLTDLSSISIVGHGAEGAIQLGSSLLDTGDLSSESAALAQIGAAVAPGGDLQLYACDAASGATGQQFIADLSQYVGGAAVAASSNLVGAAAEGGSWTLNAEVGSADVASPFTAAAEAAYSGELSLTANQIVFGVSNANGTALGSRVEQFSVSGSSASGLTDIVDGSQTAGPILNDMTGVAVDTALNEYFVAGYNYSTYEWTIQEGNISGGGSLSTFYTDPLPGLNSNNAPGGGPITGTAILLGGLALDAATKTLYFAQDAENYQTGDTIAADTGIYEISLSGGSPTLLTSPNAGLVNPNYVALDASANLLFFTDSIVAGDGFPATDNLDAANLTTGAVTVLKSFFNASDAVDTLQGLAVSGNTIYLTTRDFDDHSADFGADSANNQILSIPFSVSGSGSAATASVGAATTLYSGAGADQPTDIVVDAANGIFYTTGSDPYTVDSNLGDTTTIFEGSLSGGASLTPVLSMQDVTGPITSTSSPAFDTFSPQLVLLTQPTVTASGTVTYVYGEAAITINSGATVSDADGDNLASATVSIAGGMGAGDTLSFTNQNGITGSYSSGTLTLTGVTTAANYQTALDSVTFSTTSASATPRTIDWTVSDGVVASPTTTSTVDVRVAPVVTAGATSTFEGGGGPVVLDPGLTVSDASSITLASATVEIVGAESTDRLNFTNQNGIAGAYNLGVLTLSGVATLANYQKALESITYSVSPSNSDPTDGGSFTGREIEWTVNDGTLTSTTATSTLDTVHTAPTVIAAGTATFAGGGSPVTLDSGLAVSDVDSGGVLSSATVTVANAIAGDTLNFTNANSTLEGNIAVASDSGGVLKLTSSGSTATLAQWQTALESVTYSFSPSNGDPTDGGSDTSRTIDWVVNDGVSSSTTTTSTLDTIHTPPSLTAGGTVTYSEIGPPVALDPGLSLSDPDSGGLLTGATVQITSGFLGGDTLEATTTGLPDITVTNPGDGLLTLSGDDTLADYAAVLRSVAFSSTSPDPTNGGADTTRTITWTINDGVSTNSATETSTVVTALCFCPGTRILTDKGEIPVEHLVIGDRVATLHGEPRPIKWIGRRSYDGRFVAGQPLALPVRVARGAIDDNVPARDLWVSPGHAICIDGVLLPAWLLDNGASIAQAKKVDSVSYIHLELDEHEVIFAEGCPAETFIDEDFRNQFQNVAEFQALYPEHRFRTCQSCLPRVEEGFQLQAIRRRLAARAGVDLPSDQSGPLRGYVDRAGPDIVAGWAQSETHPEVPISLDIVVDGERVLRVLANRYRDDLRRAGLGSGKHSFEVRLPDSISGQVEVKRSLDRAPLVDLPLDQSGPLRGYVDRAGPDIVAGWAQSDTHPEVPISLDIVVDGERVLRVLANRYRDDLRQAGLGSGNHGFEVRLPDSISGKVEVERSLDRAPLALTEAAAAQAA